MSYFSTTFQPVGDTGESTTVSASFRVRNRRIILGAGIGWTRDLDPADSLVEFRRIRSRRAGSGPALLPSAEEVVAVCDPGATRPADVLLGTIRALAWLAEEDHSPATGHDDDPQQLELTHDELLEHIDRLVANRLPRERWDAVVHTETLAAVLDRLVALIVTRTAITPHPLKPNRVDDELDTALADLKTAYDHLVTDLLAGRRRLPRYQTAPAD
ncbi:DUF4254 domain-containing protein [Nocardia sp. NPDC004068]|uniref:DUF4254 domain-containing protein n=1 Tax=Nocardia sp. NPDC004068 TaxID=3364303 RepID=UPI00368E31E1